MKLVISGSESFVGKELISQCQKRDFQITGLDLVEPKISNYEYHKADINSSSIVKFIPDNADALIHLAALSRDVDCRARPYDCFNVNVLGTLNLIRAAKNKNIKQFIFASTEWVYNEFKENEVKDEDSPIDIKKHTSEYALSKLVSEANLRQQYHREFCPVTVLRFGIIYGPRKDNWSAVESIFSTIKNQKELTVGSLKNARRFIHVSDIAQGIIKSIGVDGFNTINLTGDKVITLREIVEKGQEIFKKKVKVIETNSSEISVRNPSNEKAKRILNWQPIINLEEGLKTIIDFV